MLGIKMTGKQKNKNGDYMNNIQANLPVPADFKEIENIIYSDVPMDSQILEQYPDMKKMTKRQQVILACAAMGLGVRAIAHGLGVTTGTIYTVLAAVDPDNKVRVTDEGRKAFVTRMLESRISESLLAITPEKLADSSAKELTTISKNLATIKASMNQSKHKGSSASRLSALMNEIEHDRIAKGNTIVIEEEDLEMVE
jgi:hypothetical protein